MQTEDVNVLMHSLYIISFNTKIIIYKKSAAKKPFTSDVHTTMASF